MGRSRKKVAIIIVAIIAIPLAFFYSCQYVVEYSWKCEYEVRIESMGSEDYSLQFPVPLESNSASNQTVSKFMRSVHVEEGEGELNFTNTEKGLALEVRGKGNCTILSEKSGSSEEDQKYIEKYFPETVSMKGSNGTLFFSVHSEKNVTNITVKLMVFWRSSGQTTDRLGNDYGVSGFSRGYIIEGNINDSGWTDVAGRETGITI